MNDTLQTTEGETRYNVAVELLENDGSEESREQAMKLLKEAADLGHIPSMCALGVLYDDMGDSTSALPYLVKAANLGDQGAMDALASLYRDGDYAIREQIARSATPTTYKAASCFIKGDKHARPSNIGRCIDRFFYYVPAVMSSGICGTIGFGLGWEYCPFYYIVPTILGFIGAVIGFWAFRGAKWGALWPR